MYLSKGEYKIKQTELSNIQTENTFSIADIEFIKFSDEDGITTAVANEPVFNSRFGKNNNFAESDVLKKLEEEVLPKIADAVGIENICDITTDLTTLDGLKVYGEITSKISLPTFDFYRANVHIFDKYNPGRWWWLATADSAKPHYDPIWAFCVSPDGNLYYGGYYSDNGVRPILRFLSSIFVSCEE